MPVPVAIDCPTIGILRFRGENDESVTFARYATGLQAAPEWISTSSFWLNKARFFHVRQQLNATASLARNWDSQGADPPNEIARTLANTIVDLLDATSLPPTRLTPTADGGIALSFVEGSCRAVVEIYNTGEIAAATYSDRGEPMVWELEHSESALLDSIKRIRVHLTS